MNPTLDHMLAPGLAPELVLRHIYLNVRDYAIFTMDVLGIVTSWNLGAQLVLGFAPGDIMGRSIDCIFTPQDLREGEPERERRTAVEVGRASDYRWHVRRDGSLFWADGVTTPIYAGDQLIGFLKMLRDITERKMEQDRMHRLASTDVLTGLVNRAAFDARRAEMVAATRRSRQLLLLMLIDLDQFKQVNDLLGHQAGDLLLRHVAQRLRGASRESDVVARLGGDEFALMQLYMPAPSSGGLLAEKLLHALSQPFQIGEREVRISASIGIAACPMDATTADELLKKADLALYQAKDAGRNCYRFYTTELDAVVHRKNADHRALRLAMAQRLYWLVYQPIIDIASGRTVAMEALLRMPGSLGAPGADYVIDLAQEINVIAELGVQVFRTACAQLRRWRDAGHAELRLCVNTCAQELMALDYLEQLDAILDQFQLQPSDIEIELTERDAIEVQHSGSAVIAQLRARGFRLSLDDFGTGYSSLSYLRSLPVTAIKLDKSFLRGVPDDDDANAVARMVIQLARDLRLEVIAEGVEHPEQAQFLAQLGCEAFQGHLYARAMPADAATAWLALHGSAAPPSPPS